MSVPAGGCLCLGCASKMGGQVSNGSFRQRWVEHTLQNPYRPAHANDVSSVQTFHAGCDSIGTHSPKWFDSLRPSMPGPRAQRNITGFHDVVICNSKTCRNATRNYLIVNACPEICYNEALSTSSADSQMMFVVNFC